MKAIKPNMVAEIICQTFLDYASERKQKPFRTVFLNKTTMRNGP